ncbi:MAG TPA: hypothetical protein VK183_05710 [Flavobacterium sp.]|nr:hypothetical protein [Flavobacterium sp.]
MAYKVISKPLEYSDTESLLKAEISGSFPGSPLVLNYQFTFKDERIASLKIS